jgi:Protein of unknown function (DUF3768)
LLHPEDVLTDVLERVRHFTEFTKDNDPYGEHDFGSFELAGIDYFFKIRTRTERANSSLALAEPEPLTLANRTTKSFTLPIGLRADMSFPRKSFR